MNPPALLVFLFSGFLVSFVAVSDDAAIDRSVSNEPNSLYMAEGEGSDAVVPNEVLDYFNDGSDAWDSHEYRDDGIIDNWECDFDQDCSLGEVCVEYICFEDSSIDGSGEPVNVDFPACDCEEDGISFQGVRDETGYCNCSRC